MKIHWITHSLIFLSLVLSACVPVMANEAMPNKPAGEMQKLTEVLVEKPAGTMLKSPKWFSASLTNIATGQAFTTADFKGKVVLVEAMAQWCPTCLKQQQQILDLEKTMGNNPDFVIVSLDIDPNENASDLKKYIESNGFTWMYAVAPADVSGELAKLYGTQFLNPPSTPMLVIDRKGEVTVLPLGTIKSSIDLQQATGPLLKAGV
jgi:thiol-disulfide isomerase/thioredoxin